MSISQVCGQVDSPASTHQGLLHIVRFPQFLSHFYNLVFGTFTSWWYLLQTWKHLSISKYKAEKSEQIHIMSWKSKNNEIDIECNSGCMMILRKNKFFFLLFPHSSISCQWLKKLLFSPTILCRAKTQHKYVIMSEKVRTQIGQIIHCAKLLCSAPFFFGKWLHLNMRWVVFSSSSSSNQPDRERIRKNNCQGSHEVRHLADDETKK